MQSFTIHTGVAVPLDRANIDTDAIIPKQFLKSIRRTGFGESLFFDWRYLEDGSENPSFILNQPVYRNASVLVAGNNFGCGSSREHAVWAVTQFGFRAVIAPREEKEGEIVPAFADIFRNNSAKNGLLLVELKAGEVRAVCDLLQACPGAEITIDLPAQTVSVEAGSRPCFAFGVDPALKESLMRGLDDISRTLEYAAQIDDFERRHDVQMAPEDARG